MIFDTDVLIWCLRGNPRAAKAIAVVHCVEGGFALGDTPDHVRENVRAMAEDGIAYVTVAHLLYRQVAANVPPIPSFGILGDGAKADQWCHKHLPVPSNVGLTPLGKVLIEELVRNGIFVDLTHLNTRAMTEALDLMDQLDPGMQIPVLASHGAYRFRSREYNLSAEQVVRVVKRQGTVGVLLCRDFLDDDRGRSPDLGLFCEHLRALAQAISKELPHVDPYAHLGIGTDLDGFIQPLDGVETAGRLQNLARRLKEELPQSAASVCSGSAYSLLSSGARQGKSVGGRVPWAPVPG